MFSKNDKDKLKSLTLHNDKLEDDIQVFDKACADDENEI